MSSQNRQRMSAAAVFAVLGVAASAHADTLVDAVVLAYQTNPQIQAQRATQRITDEAYVQAEANLGPQLSASASISKTSPRPYEVTNYTIVNGNFLPIYQYENAVTTFGVSASQPLFGSGGYAAAVDAAEADVFAGRQTLRATEEQVLQSVITVYADVRRDAESLGIRAENVRVLQKQLDQTKAEFEVGQVTRTDVAQAEARLAAADALLAAAKAQLEVSRANYVAVIGQSPANLEPEPALIGMPGAIDSALEIANKAAPNLLAAQYHEQASRIRIAQAKSAYGPKVGLSVTWQDQNLQGFGLGYQSQTTGGVSLTIPIFTSGLLASQVRQAHERNNVDALSVDSARRSLVQSVSQAYAQLISARSQVVSNSEQVRANKIAYEGVQQEQQVGLRTIVEVLNADQELRDSELALVSARHDEYVAGVNLLASIGALSVASVNGKTPAYDPLKYFDDVKGRGGTPLNPLIKGADHLGGFKADDKPNPLSTPSGK